MNLEKLFCLIAVTTILVAAPLHAQNPPDAGRTLQELAPAPEPPKPSKGITIESPKSGSLIPGGAQTKLKSVSFSGNSRFSETELLKVLGDVTDKAFDMAGLRALTDRIAEYYRMSGYPFARVFLPPQTLNDGILRIEIVEGRYGKVQATGDGSLSAQAQGFLNALTTGSVIESSALERATLILDDQPGIKTIPIIRPGQEQGSGDLDVNVSRDKRFGMEIGMDNHGNRYTGEYRGRLNIQFNSPFLLGDQISIRSLLSDELLWLGAVDYSLPLGSSGLRGKIGFDHTSYELGKQFSRLDATGTADVISAGITYPLLRSQKANVTLGITYQHKELEDKTGSINTKNSKSSDAVPATMQFDLRDAIGGGGVTFGSLVWTSGSLRLDAGLLATDSATAKTNGGFNKVNLDVARMQALPADFMLYGRLSSQWAFNNLDSSEGFGLGGPNGVRAYPVSEAYGDEGWLTQLELRYTVKAFSPYFFYDIGGSAINADPWDTGRNHRTVSGTGLGLKYNQSGWNFDASVAWRIEGGKPESDTQDRNPRVWFNASYRY